MPIYHVNKYPFGFLDTKFGKGNASLTTTYGDVDKPTASGAPALNNMSQGAATTLYERAKDHVGGNLSQGQVTHFVNHWLGTWWPNLSVADTLRWGISKAIEHANNANKGAGLPMEFFWVCLQDNVFQVYYSEGLQQVTVLILTPPPPPGYDPGPLTKAEDLWVVKRWDKFDDDYPTINNTTVAVAPPEFLGPTTTGPAGTIIRQRIWHSD